MVATTVFRNPRFVLSAWHEDHQNADAYFTGRSTAITRWQQVVTLAGLSKQRLDDLVDENKTEPHSAAVERLLKEMCAATKQIKAKRLGVIGKEVFTRRLMDIEGVSDNVIYLKEFIEGAEPLVTEMVIGTRERCAPEQIDEEDDGHYPSDGRRLRYGLNFSPALKTPYKSIPEVLQEMMAEGRDPLRIAIHSTAPHVEFEDRGKSMLSGGDDD